ncbi:MULTISPECIES: hypothetical protein [unclassified Variovorax]|jgi:ABC-type cobalamin transport system permease subunit|uniref:hypothetical protein n=1 Tax=unclassified Variovorax TaxID=663243 RepID=UPI000F7F5F28|nr:MULTISPECIES: hypothetical protein [unclassified Variovorax]RSZ38476.1 hypothetical protein EJO70_20330 [Variovorax sp. 553]RSZ39072.1 hypothetical protein EJO71_18920 [Variovorax sp. 679]
MKIRTLPRRRTLIAFAMLVPAALAVRSVRAQAAASGVQLFKVVSSRDEVIVGADAALLGAGSGPAVERLAAQLTAKGQLTLWQYASSKDAGGALVQAPLRQIVVFKNDALRIEPYATPLPIQPLK